MNMLVTIELLGVQRDIVGEDQLSMSIIEDTVLRDAFEYVLNKYPQLALDEDTVLIAVNDKLAPLDQPLKANDVICILPYIGGG